MDDMKFRICMMGLAGLLACATGAVAVTYYIDDNSNVGDVYTPGFTGNDSNDGLTPSTPKLTLNNLLASTNLLPGDVVLIDTGMYPVTNTITLGTSLAGVAGSPILFKGSTNLATDGTTFTSSTSVAIFDVRGSHLHFQKIRTWGGGNGFLLTGARNCEFDEVQALYAGQAIRLLNGASSNSFRRCVMHAVTYSATGGDAPGSGNYMENCVAWSTVSAAFAPHAALYSNFVNNIGFGVYALGSAGYGPPIGSQNVFWYSGSFSPSYETLSDYARVNTNFVGNTVADPKFANAADFDFHLLSAAGYVSNGVWVTNPAVGYSPGIDFGPRE
jgi:hypothetical protein